MDILVYGLWMTALCLSSFSLVIWGFGDGDLGLNCNKNFNSQCEPVFRARATTFISLTWFALFLAWEMVDMRRSFFRMQPDSKRISLSGCLMSGGISFCFGYPSRFYLGFPCCLYSCY